MDPLDAALDLMRRLPPSDLTTNFSQLVSLVPELEEELLAAVDQPLKVANDSTGRAYLICEYNRDDASWRSPWTNTYDPIINDAAFPSAKLRELEIIANDAFDTYREL